LPGTHNTWRWSPQQISGWLKRQYPHDESLRVSHETIYRSLFIQDFALPQRHGCREPRPAIEAAFRKQFE